MKNFLRKVSQKRVLYSRVFFTMLIFTVMVLTCFLFANNLVHQHLYQNTEKSLDYAQYQIEALLLESEITLDSFARAVQNMLLQGSDTDQLQRFISDMSAYISGRGTSASGVRGFYGFFEKLADDPVFLRGADLALPDDFDPTLSIWYKSAVKEGGGIVEILSNEAIALKETIITYAQCLFDDEGRRLGVVCMDVAFGGISETLAKTATEINGIGVLISSDLTVIYHNNPDFVSQPVRNPELPFSIFADELERGENITERPYVDYLGQKSVAFFRSLPNNWFLGLIIPKGPYYEPVTRMTVILFALGAVFAAVLIFILIHTDNAFESTKQLVNMNPLSVHLWDRDNNIIDCNEESLRLYGIKSKEENISRFYELSPEYQPDGQLTKDKVAASIQKAFNDGRLTIEWMHRTLDGEPLPVEMTLIRVPYKKDYLVAAYARDLREHEKMMEDIRAASAKLSSESSTLKTIFNLAPDHIFCKDLNLKYVRCNDSMMNYFKLKEEDVVGKGDADGLFLPESIEEEHRVMDRRVMAEHKMFTYEEYIPDLEGRVKVFETSKLPLIQDGEVTGLIGIAHDITRRKEMEETTKRANNAKSAFLANMSHEIRTPMNTIIGIAEIQLQEDELPDSVKESLNMIYNAGELLLGIINDLLDLSKIEADKFELTPAKYDMASLINDTMVLNMARLGSKSIEFELCVEETVPTTLFGDELRIKQILNNLLSNAFKYTKQGGIKFSVATSKEDDRPEDTIVVVFKVADTGIGMTDEQVGKLFEEYTRFNMEANRETQGTGLGMSITKNLIDKMEAEISVVSTPNEGSEFTVRIPQKKVGEDVLGKELAENLRLFRDSGMKQLRKSRILVEPMPYGSILIVDDVESNAYVAKGLMKPYKLTVDSVTSGYDAIELVRKGNKYDIIFMDHMMPGMDGIEATSTIRKMGYTEPIVALTANAVVGQSDIFMDNGFDSFIAKPIDTRALNTVLKKYVRDKQLPEVIKAAHLQYAGMTGKEHAISAEHTSIDPVLAGIFLRDVQKALVVLEQTNEKRDDCTDADLQAYVVAVHGLKSLLANVGEADLSAIARKLEQAGRNKELAVVFDEGSAFIGKLRSLMENIAPVKSAASGEATDEDLLFLREKLHTIQDACMAYDGKTVDAAISDLRQKDWPTAINDFLLMITEQLLHSDFEDIVVQIDDELREMPDADSA